MLKDEKDVYFSFGSVQDHGASKASQGMHSSKFCLNIAGDPASHSVHDECVGNVFVQIFAEAFLFKFNDTHSLHSA